MVAEVAESVGEAACFLDHSVDRLGAAVAHPTGVEVGQDLLLPGSQGAPEPGYLGDGAGGQSSDDLLGPTPPLTGVRGVIAERSC